MMRKSLFAASVTIALLTVTALATNPAAASQASSSTATSSSAKATDTIYATAGVYAPLDEAIGVQSEMTIAKPRLAPQDVDTYAGIQVFETGGLDGIEFTWLVDRAQGDTRPHLVARTWFNDTPNCRNCDFVDIGRTHHLGERLRPGVGKFALWHASRRWYVAFDGEPVAYVPDSKVSPKLEGEKIGIWGAQVDYHEGTVPCSEMGNGHPAESPLAASQHIGLIGAKLTEVVSSTKHFLYSVSVQDPTHFRYGGPGAC